MNAPEAQEIERVLALMRQGHRKRAIKILESLLIKTNTWSPEAPSGLELDIETETPDFAIDSGHLVLNDEGWLIEVEVIRRIEKLILQATNDGEIKRLPQ